MVTVQHSVQYTQYDVHLLWLDQYLLFIMSFSLAIEIPLINGTPCFISLTYWVCFIEKKIRLLSYWSQLYSLTGFWVFSSSSYIFLFQIFPSSFINADSKLLLIEENSRESIAKLTMYTFVDMWSVRVHVSSMVDFDYVMGWCRIILIEDEASFIL